MALNADGSVAGGLANSNNGWQSFTPAVLPASGSFTTLGATSGRYTTNGKTCHFQIDVTITANGNAAGYLVISLPVPALELAAFAGGEQAKVGFALRAIASQNSASMAVLKYDGSYPGGDGYRLVITGTYETQ